jgi:hypothetical protein
LEFHTEYFLYSLKISIIALIIYMIRFFFIEEWLNGTIFCSIMVIEII